jgi:hypothetical protein
MAKSLYVYRMTASVGQIKQAPIKQQNFSTWKWGTQDLAGRWVATTPKIAASFSYVLRLFSGFLAQPSERNGHSVCGIYQARLAV